MAGAMQRSLNRLTLDNAVIQRMAVGSVFHLLGLNDAYKTKAGAAVIQQCLGSASSVRPILLQWSLQLPKKLFRAHRVLPTQAVVEEAAEQLCAFVPRPGGQSTPYAFSAAVPIS